MFLDSIDNEIDQIANVQWGNTLHWDVRFLQPSFNNLSPPPSPFSDWFPATTVTENTATLASQQYESHLSTFSIPQKSSEYTLSMSFYDDSNHTLLQWFSNWINKEVLNDGKSITPLKESVRILVLVKYQVVDGKKQIVKDIQGNTNDFGFKAYYVYPDTTLNYEGTSDSGVPEYSIDFKICGTVD